MVEAPRIRILYERIRFTKGKKIINIYGTSYKKYNIDLIGYIIRKWWYAGKYLYTYLIKNNISYVVRTHMMMYGKIVINTDIIVNPKLTRFMTWELDDGTTLVWYLSQITILDPTCQNDIIKSNYIECTSVEIIKDSIKMMKFDISNDKFDQSLTIQRIEKHWCEFKNDIMVDLLLDQKFFPGVGNILQQEALYRCKINPVMIVDYAGITVIKCLINELKNVIDLLYKSYENKLHGLQHQPILQIYRKAYCPLGHKTITKYLGYHNRRTTWCPVCQYLDHAN